MIKRMKIALFGIVQGVGFRPFVYKEATKLKLNGTVINSSAGVLIDIEGEWHKLLEFIKLLNSNKPNRAVIDDMKIEFLKPLGRVDFSILESVDEKSKVAIIPSDIGVCEECLKELKDKTNRRFNYPFINCINCGVRFSIIKSLPYDRANTSMNEFEMCSECEDEYINPNNRRYHAQPISCFKCGPELALKDKNWNLIDKNYEAIVKLSNIIKDGYIVAIKGVGGFHLVCDALNFETVKRLREIKKRARKPFAIVAKDIEMVQNIAYVNSLEESCLNSLERPIVLLNLKDGAKLSKNIAPSINKIGVMLPSNPIYHLLLELLNSPIVCTSANISDEPIVSNSDELVKIKYDYVLDYNRNIINIVDDSILQVVDDKVMTLRRGRGFAPIDIKLPFSLNQNILSVGANQKSVVAIAFKNIAILSPHIGDLNSFETMKHFKNSINRLKLIYDFSEDLIVKDKNQSYYSSKFAQNGVAIQHHYAHFLSVLIEHKLENRDYLGVIFDGSGLGDDGTIWGGEFIIGNYNKYKRAYHLEKFRLLGGEVAIKEPKRILLSLLFDIFGRDINIDYFSENEIDILYKIYQKGINSPFTSSMGRVFDGVASLYNIVQVLDYEGESGLILESFYDENISDSYNFSIDGEVIKFKEIFKEMIHEDKTEGISKFFNTVVEMILTIAKKEALPLVLSGGVFQNSTLCNILFKKLKAHKIEFYINERVPVNDGGIALGQIGFNKF